MRFQQQPLLSDDALVLPPRRRSLSDPNPQSPRSGRAGISAHAAQLARFQGHVLTPQGILWQQPSLGQTILSVVKNKNISVEALVVEEVYNSHGNAWESTKGSPSLVTMAILVKTFLTGTILVLPGLYLRGGFVGTTVGIVLVGSMETYGMCLLVRCSVNRGGGDYAELGEALGANGTLIVSIMLVASQYAFVCAEQIYVAENVLAVVGQFLPWLKQWHILFSFQLILVPLSWVRNLRLFAVTNIIGDALTVCAVVWLLGFCASRLVQDGHQFELQPVGTLSNEAVIVGTCGYVYEGINMVLPTFEAHERKETFHLTLTAVMASMTVLFIVFGFAWLCAFGSDVADVATRNLPTGSIATLAIPLMFAFALVFTTPVLFFPIAPVLEPRIFTEAVLSRCPLSRRVMENTLRTILMLASAGIAAFAGTSFHNFLSLIGGFCCFPLAIVFPAAISLKWGDLSRIRRVLSYVLILVGVFFTIITSTLATMTWSSS